MGLLLWINFLRGGGWVRNYDNYFNYISRGHHCEIGVPAAPNRAVHARGCGPASRKDGDTDQLVPLVPHPINTATTYPLSTVYVNDEKSESTDGTIVLSAPV